MKRKYDSVEYRRKWGIPDWRDGSAYPKNLTDTLWRWEFLRRRKDYRADWENHWQATLKLYKENSPRDLFLKREIFPNNWGLNETHPRFRAHMEGSLEKYNLEGLPNPALREPYLLLFKKPKKPGYMRAGELTMIAERVTIGIPKEHAALLIDLAAPIKPQLDYYLEIFKDWQSALNLTIQGNRRRHRLKWGRHLRVIDARAEGATYTEIGEIVLSRGLPYSEAAARAKEAHKEAETVMKEFGQSTK